jgi:hypothetical protein
LLFNQQGDGLVQDQLDTARCNYYAKKL